MAPQSNWLTSLVKSTRGDLGPIVIGRFSSSITHLPNLDHVLFCRTELLHNRLHPWEGIIICCYRLIAAQQPLFHVVVVCGWNCCFIVHPWPSEERIISTSMSMIEKSRKSSIPPKQVLIEILFSYHCWLWSKACINHSGIRLAVGLLSTITRVLGLF